MLVKLILHFVEEYKLVGNKMLTEILVCKEGEVRGECRLSCNDELHNVWVVKSKSVWVWQEMCIDLLWK